MFFSKAIIGGGASGDVQTATFDRTDPSSGDVITRAAACDVAMAGQAANAAAATFPAWAGADAAVRANALLSTASHLGERTDELAAIAAKEVGATASWTAFNIQIAQATLRHAATLADAIGESLYTAEGQQRRYIKLTKPVGVVLGIAPWNAPVTLAVRAVAAPLALGNTVVLKGSELCPRTHEIVAQAFLDGGVPTGAINYVVNAPDDAHAVVDALVAHPAVRRVNFTGSSRAGREVAMMAARHLKKCLLELSGKAPMIVLEGADPATHRPRLSIRPSTRFSIWPSAYLPCSGLGNRSASISTPRLMVAKGPTVPRNETISPSAGSDKVSERNVL